LAKLGILAIKDIERDEVEFICKSTGCKPIADIDSFTEDKLGSADLVEEVQSNGSRMVKVTGAKATGKTVSVVVRGVSLRRSDRERISITCASGRWLSTARPPDVQKVGAENYKGPGLVVQWVEVEGPLLDSSWPPKSHRLIFGDLRQEPVPDAEHSGRREVVSQRRSEPAQRAARLREACFLRGDVRLGIAAVLRFAFLVFSRSAGRLCHMIPPSHHQES
jgi:hypothetical protein